MNARSTIDPDVTMRDLLAEFPGAQRALFRKYHIGGCSHCGFSPEETLAQVCARNENLDVDLACRRLGNGSRTSKRPSLPTTGSNTALLGNPRNTLVFSRQAPTLVSPMSDNPSRISISVNEGTFDISGSETFVKEQIADLKGVLTALVAAKSQSPIAPPLQLGSRSAKPPSEFPNVLEITDGQVNVIKIPDSGKRSERSLGAALIYLWAKAQQGIAEVPFAEIRRVCQIHGCLDESNFAAHMKASPSDIIVGGGGKSQTAKLTVPGTKRALDLLQQLNGADGQRSEPAAGQGERRKETADLQLTTGSIAAKLNVKNGSDLLLSACARLALVDHRDTFSRKEILREAKTATGYYSENVSKHISRELDKLVRQKKINEVSSDTYALQAVAKEELTSQLGSR